MGLVGKELFDAIAVPSTQRMNSANRLVHNFNVEERIVALR